MGTFLDHSLANGSLPADAQTALGKVQGLILEKARRDFAVHFFIRFRGKMGAPAVAKTLYPIPSVIDLQREGAAIRADLDGEITPKVLKPICFLGFSSTGIQKAGYSPSMCPEFNAGFRAQANGKLRLPDTEWHPSWKCTRFDAILSCYASSQADVKSAEDDISNYLGAQSSLSIGWIERANVYREETTGPAKGHAVEHFGFADGVSQPSFLPTPAGRPAAPGFQFPLRQALMNETLPGLPDDCYGSFNAFLRIEQHVDRFWNAVEQISRSVTALAGICPRQHAAALLIGRHADGRPLEPGGPGINGFDRASDPKGDVWPYASHISKMNPRTGSGARPIIRRGMTYQDNGEVGMLFQSFQSDLGNQFEVLISEWANDPNHPFTNTGQDPLTGRVDYPQCFPTTNQRAVNISRLVTIKGGEYFYFPSLPAIEMLRR